jgi:DNA-binding PadR family transcriptional regulator
MQPSPFLGGPTELLVLLVLRRARLHGWGIMLRLQQLSRDGVQLDELAVSSTLRRLQERGWVEAEVKTVEATLTVPVYRLTRQGRQHCKQLREEYARITTAIARLMLRT